MTYDPKWDEVHAARKWGAYPPEELVRFVMRHYGKAENRAAIRILEIGCGGGANLWFLAREGFTATGVDGCRRALDLARERLNEDMRFAELVQCDACQLADEFQPESFDAVIDVCCLECFTKSDAEAIIKQAHALLVPGGRFFTMLVAAGSWGSTSGCTVPGDPHARTAITEGPLTDCGIIHFWAGKEVDIMLKPYGMVACETAWRTLENGTRHYGHYIVETQRA